MDEQSDSTDRASFPTSIIGIAFLVLAVSFASWTVLGLSIQEWSAAFGWSRGEMSASKPP